MTRFEDLLSRERHRSLSPFWQACLNDLLVLLVAGAFLLGGWMLKDWMHDQFRYLALGDIAIPYPPYWILQSRTGDSYQIAPRHVASDFPPTESARLLPVPKAPLIETWPAQRAKELDHYIELARQRVTLADGRDALLLTYAYVVSPEGEDAAPLVAVQGVDLAFRIRYQGEKRLMVMTLTAETGEWKRLWPLFHRLIGQFGVHSP